MRRCCCCGERTALRPTAVDNAGYNVLVDEVNVTNQASDTDGRTGYRCTYVLASQGQCQVCVWVGVWSYPEASVPQLRLSELTERRRAGHQRSLPFHWHVVQHVSVSSSLPQRAAPDALWRWDGVLGSQGETHSPSSPMASLVPSSSTLFSGVVGVGCSLALEDVMGVTLGGRSFGTR